MRRSPGVAAFGVFVTLDEIFVEGLVHVSALGDDYFHFDPIRHRLNGEHSHRAFRLSDRMRVRLTKVDLDERRVDFEPEVREPGRGPDRRGGTKRGRDPRRRRR